MKLRTILFALALLLGAASLTRGDEQRMLSMTSARIVALLGYTPASTGANTFTGTQTAPYLVTSGGIAGYEFDSRSSGDGYIWYSNGGVATLYDVTTNQPRLSVSMTGVVAFGTGAPATGVSGEASLPKIAASGTAPGAGSGKLALIAGTTAGTCKLIIYAGTSTAPSTILDNIGGGC